MRSRLICPKGIFLVCDVHVLLCAKFIFDIYKRNTLSMVAVYYPLRLAFIEIKGVLIALITYVIWVKSRSPAAK